MSRDIVFKMENPYEHIKEGVEVTVEESKLQGGLVVYYTIIPAIAMSANFKKSQGLRNFKGIVKEVRPDGVAFYVTVTFEE